MKRMYISCGFLYDFMFFCSSFYFFHFYKIDSFYYFRFIKLKVSTFLVFKVKKCLLKS